MSASAKKKSASKPAGPSFIFMICKAIGGIKSGNQGASRTAIANYIMKNFGKTAGGHFNASIRSALKKGIISGVLRQGVTAQRFKLGQKAKSITNPPKKKKPKKKKVTKKKKKKTTKKKKKKTTKKKKKVTKKKKKTTKKKKKTTK
eukprot:113308_1